jgi:hypothetical protein
VGPQVVHTQLLLAVQLMSGRAAHMAAADLFCMPLSGTATMAASNLFCMGGGCMFDALARPTEMNTLWSATVHGCLFVEVVRIVCTFVVVGLCVWKCLRVFCSESFSFRMMGTAGNGAHLLQCSAGCPHYPGSSKLTVVPPCKPAVWVLRCLCGRCTACVASESRAQYVQVGMGCCRCCWQGPTAKLRAALVMMLG